LKDLEKVPCVLHMSVNVPDQIILRLEIEDTDTIITLTRYVLSSSRGRSNIVGVRVSLGKVSP